MTESTATTQLPAGVWALEAGSSTAGFTAHQLGHAVPGSIPISLGTVGVGPDRSIRSGHVELDLSAIATGNTKRDSDLAKPSLLDTGHFPTFSVDIAPATWTGDGWKSTATIGVRGVVFDIDVVIRLDAAEPNGVVRVVVTAAFDRKPIGMKAPRIAIGRNIEILVRATFIHS